MGRFIGNRFGSIAPVVADDPAVSAVYTMSDQYYIKQDGGWIVPMTATGGSKSNPSPTIAKHVFTATGPFTVDSGSGTITYLLLSGGGGGSAGGGGGGGIKYGTMPAVQPGPYPVTVGTGGAKGADPNDANMGGKGGTSSWAGPTTVSIAGGGGGFRWGYHTGNVPTAQLDAAQGATGGGAGNRVDGSGGTGEGDKTPNAAPADQSSPTNGWGCNGGGCGGSPEGQGAGGGGGAGNNGEGPRPDGSGNSGGEGLVYSMHPAYPSAVGGGGGGGGREPGCGAGEGVDQGGGTYGDGVTGGPGDELGKDGNNQYGGGGGGGGYASDTGYPAGGEGGDGLVVLQYPL